MIHDSLASSSPNIADAEKHGREEHCRPMPRVDALQAAREA